MERHEKEIKRGFNIGYLLTKFQPDLFPETIKRDLTNPYITGLFAGKDRFLKEKEMGKDLGKSKTIDKLAPIKPVTKGPTKGR